jgi:hypothetical protein
MIYDMIVQDMNIKRLSKLVMKIMLGAVVIEYMNMGKHLLFLFNLLTVTISLKLISLEEISYT